MIAERVKVRVRERERERERERGRWSERGVLSEKDKETSTQRCQKVQGASAPCLRMAQRGDLLGETRDVTLLGRSSV